MSENIAEKIITMMDKAVELTNKKDFEGADNICADVLKICPGFPDALHIKGIVNQELGKSNDAMDLILTAIKNSPKVHYYYISLANVYMRLAKYIDAIDACNSALNLKPDSSKAHKMLAAVYRETGEIDKAIKHLENAIQHEPSDIQLQCKYAVFIAEAGNVNAAFDICLPLKEKNPDNADLTQSLGYIYELDHDIEKAKQYYYESITLDPKNSAPYLKLAYLDKNTNDTQELIINLEEIFINENLPYFEESCLNCSL